MKKFYPIAKFQSKNSGHYYIVHQSKNQLTDEIELTCTCKGYIFNKKCKHIEYVKNNPELRTFQQITDIPTREEAEKMQYGKNFRESKKWTEEHLLPILL
jgi:hypothetical protein